MKKLLLLFTLTLLIGNVGFSAFVKLKITYKDQPVVGHTVSVMIGDANLGQGVTDSDGKVTITVRSLPTKDIDLKGEKSCDGATKSWSVQGFVLLDDNNYAHLKMEEPIAMAVEAFGFMSADMLVASYGLLCSGSSTSNNSNASNSNGTNSNGTNSNGTNNTTGNNPNNAFMDSMNLQIQATQDQFKPAPVQNAASMTPEERMQATKLHYENKVYTGGKKIEKKKEKLAAGGMSEDDQRELEFEIRELEIEQAIDQNKLDETNLMIEKNGLLNKQERDQFNDKEKGLKEELKALKEAKKSNSAALPSSSPTSDNKEDDQDEEDKEKSNNKKEESLAPGEFEANEIQAILNADTLNVSLYIDFNVENLSTMSEDELQKCKTQFTTDTNNKSLKLRAKGRWMEEVDRIQLENEIASCEKALKLIDLEFDRREAIRKAEKKNR